MQGLRLLFLHHDDEMEFIEPTGVKRARAVPAQVKPMAGGNIEDRRVDAHARAAEFVNAHPCGLHPHTREAALAQFAPQHGFGKRAAAVVGRAHREYADHGRPLR